MAVAGLKVRVRIRGRSATVTVQRVLPAAFFTVD